MFQPNAIVISHEHLDHVDPWFLARVPSHVPVIIHQYPSPALKHKILSGGYRPVIDLPAWQRTDLPGGGSVFFVPEESPMNHDAAIVIEGEERTILNLNDARLSPVQFREIRARVQGTIDLLCLQGAGASWYPVCYAYPEQRRRELARRKRFAKFAYVARAVRVVEPGAVLPFAGPPCFLDPDLFHHNAELDKGIFPDQQQVADWLNHRGIHNTVVLLPGDKWDPVQRRKGPDPIWNGFAFADRLPYLQAYAERRRPQVQAVLARHPEPNMSLWGEFCEYFTRLLEMSPYFNRRINMRVGFDITGPGGGQWAVDFRAGTAGVFQSLDGCSYRYRLASRLLPPLLTGAVPWEDFTSSPLRLARA